MSLPSPTALDALAPFSSPALSIIIVAYRSRHHLERLLPSLYAQTFTNFEIIVVDNDPQDGSALWLKRTYPEVRVITQEQNGGYAGGNNLGLKHALGRWVLILNPDTELPAGTLETLLCTARAQPNALINPKIFLADGTLYACGNEMHYTGITTCLGLGQPPAAYRGLFALPLLSGTAFIASKAVLEELGGFDDDYFMYYEDTDLSLRARLKGYELICDAEAVLTHHCALGISSPEKFYFLERNRLQTLVKTFELKTLVRLMPALFLTELATWTFALLKGPRYLAARCRSYFWLCQHAQRLRCKRRVVQRSRRLTDEVLLEQSLTQLPFRQLVPSATLAGLLDRLTRPLYALIQPNRRS